MSWRRLLKATQWAVATWPKRPYLCMVYACDYPIIVIGTLSVSEQCIGTCGALGRAWFSRLAHREFRRRRGNAGRSLHSAFFAKVVDAYRGYLSSWVPQVLCEPEC
ncbi:hypothetical protein Taro_016287 [Colocasia esculenta]|uniref:Uncharacterized protein n=1 Tax=Colocasia esculenta TaxID=4460 RepID=A0A843UVT2_COLES|nr:hypothetical protein [Colocasia esculenta]